MEKVNILGAGVVGLTTGCLLQAQGYQCKITCKASTENWEQDPIFTSPKAGAHWRSVASAEDKKTQLVDKITFEMLKKLIDLDPTQAKKIGVFMVPGYELWTQKPADFVEPWFKNLVPNYREMAKSEMPSPEFNFGIRYETFCMDVAVYLPWLLNKFKEMGGVIEYKTINHIDQLMDDANIIVNCSGLQSRTLGGVEDEKVYPTRGQVVIVKAPWVNYTVTGGDPRSSFTYVIPRSNGDVILGGTYQENESNLQPDLEIARNIIDRVKKVYPEFKEKSFEILHHRVGLRPTRVGGIRIESETRIDEISGKKKLVIHNYGHGGGGFQGSWGSAFQILNILQTKNSENLFEKITSTIAARL